MIELTAEQRSQMNSDGTRFIDPETKTKYVLVPEEVYERIEALLTPNRLTPDEQRACLHAAGMRAGWNDPEMDVYDCDDAEIKP